MSTVQHVFIAQLISIVQIQAQRSFKLKNMPAFRGSPLIGHNIEGFDNAQAVKQRKNICHHANLKWVGAWVSPTTVEPNDIMLNRSRKIAGDIAFGHISATWEYRCWKTEHIWLRLIDGFACTIFFSNIWRPLDYATLLDFFLTWQYLKSFFKSDSFWSLQWTNAQKLLHFADNFGFIMHLSWILFTFYGLWYWEMLSIYLITRCTDCKTQMRYCI